MVPARLLARGSVSVRLSTRLALEVNHEVITSRDGVPGANYPVTIRADKVAIRSAIVLEP